MFLASISLQNRVLRIEVRYKAWNLIHTWVLPLSLFQYINVWLGFFFHVGIGSTTVVFFDCNCFTDYNCLAVVSASFLEESSHCELKGQ